MRLGRLSLVLLLLSPLAYASAAPAAECLHQPSRSESAISGCANAAGLLGATGLALMPDSTRLFVAATRSSAVTTFARDPATGDLAWRGCVSDNGTDGADGTGGRCVDGHALKGAKALAVSPDARHLYVAATRSGAIDTFSLAGELPVQIGCLKESAIDSRCDEGRGLAGARSVAVSPDGRHIYVAAAAADSVTWLERDGATGRPHGGGCVSADGSDGACADGHGLLRPSGVAVSADGRWVQVVASGSGAATTFARDARDGHLTQVDCVMADPPRSGPCRRMRTLAGAYGVAVGGSGTVAVAGRAAGAITLLRRDTKTGRLSRVACAASRRGACGRAPGLGAPEAVAMSGDAIVATSAGGTVAILRQRAGRLAPSGCFAAITRRGSPCPAVPGLAGAAGVVLVPGGRQAYVTAAGAHAVQTLPLEASG